MTGHRLFFSAMVSCFAVTALWPAGALGQETASIGRGPDYLTYRELLAGSRDTTSQRRRAVELSRGYEIRLKIHRIGSYVELPLLATQYLIGRRLYSDIDKGVESEGYRNAHRAVAIGIGTLFTVNTVTGVWNLIEGFQQPEGRTRRIVHGVAMLVADAGFLAAALMRPSDDFERRDTHRALAIGAVSVATVSTLVMWLWN